MKYFNIPVFVPHLGCPFDCVFCNQRRITGVDTNIGEENVERIITEHIKLLPKEDCQIEIAFFGGSFTGIEEDLQERLLACAKKYIGQDNIVGIRVSTRPDYISHAVLERLLKYGVSTIELGVQSMDNDVLSASCRGHSKEQVAEAVEIIREYPINLGLQMMTGLPLDTKEKTLKTADGIIELRPDFVRIYPTLVIKNTRLCQMYENGEYKPQSVDEAVAVCHELLKKFNTAGINVIRLGLQNTDEISPDGSVVAGPYHSAFGELVESEVYYDKITEILKKTGDDEVIIYVNPTEVSKASGHKRKNIIRAYSEFGKKIKIKKDEGLKKGEIRI